MKINIKSPFFPEVAKEVDLDNFVKIDVNITEELESNHFLLSLWHQLDVNYAPQHTDRVPWAYIPQKYIGKKINILVFGNINTKIGNYVVAMSYAKKGNIDSLYFYSPFHEQEHYKKYFKEIVSNAIKHKNELSIFNCKTELKSQFNNLQIQQYKGDNFTLYSENNKIWLSFNLKAIDQYEAFRSSMKRLNYLCAFLSVETNILFEFQEIVLTNNQENIIKTDVEHQYFIDFIDFYSVKEDVLQLSEYGFKFLDDFVFVERDLIMNRRLKYFILACQHISEGLYHELKLGDKTAYTFPKVSFVLSPNDLRNKQAFITQGVMSYMSAIETASFPDGTTTQCATCHNLQYKISSRISDFMTHYFHEDMGKLFKSLYGFRSKFLHTGELATDNDYHYNRPLIDSSTETGLVDYGFISVKVNGNVGLIYINNIREWTTYALRCYYQEYFYNRLNFNLKNSMDENNSDSYIAHYEKIVVSSCLPGIEVIGLDAL